MSKIFGPLMLLLALPTVAMRGVGGLGPRISSEAVAAEETEIVAAQIRRQGFVCDNPMRAEPDREHSKPNEAVWVLKCQNATYRVRLIPKRAAHIERID
jgi:hypothetical protein